MKQTYAIIGLGKFGTYIAQGLMQDNINLIIVDKHRDKLKDFKDKIENVFILDTTDVDALKEAGLSNIDVAFVSIGTDVEGSILTVMALKEIGVKKIVAKAISPIHGKILSKIGVNRVIYPERDAAKRLIKDFVEHMDFEIIDITNSLKIAIFYISQRLSNISIREFKAMLQGGNLKIMSHKHHGKWSEPNDDDILNKDDSLIIFGSHEDITEFASSYAR